MKFTLFVLLSMASTPVLATGVAASSPKLTSGQLKPYYPKRMGKTEAFYCVLGNATSWKGCEPISEESLKKLDACSSSVNIDGDVGKIGYSLLNSYGEATFFQELANRSVRSIECQLKILQPAHRPQLADSAWQVYDNLQKLIQKLVIKRDQLQREYHGDGLAAADPRTTQGSRADANRTRIQEEVDSIDNAIDGLLGQVPFGTQDTTRDALKALSGKIVSEEDFKRAYNGTLDANATVLTAGLASFNRARNQNTGYFDLTFDQRKALFESPGAKKILDQIDPQRKTLGCRFNRCFEKGAKNSQFAAIGGLTVVTVLTAGQASPLLVMALAGASAGVSVTKAFHTCSQKTFVTSTDELSHCSAASLAKYTVQKKNDLNCHIDVAMALLDGFFLAKAAKTVGSGVVAGLKEARALKVEKEQLNAAASGEKVGVVTGGKEGAANSRVGSASLPSRSPSSSIAPPNNVVRAAGSQSKAREFMDKFIERMKKACK